MPYKIIEEMLAEGEIKGFYASGGKGVVLQVETLTHSASVDTVLGDFVIDNEAVEPDGYLTQELEDLVNDNGEWVDAPLFWATDETPEEYTGN